MHIAHVYTLANWSVFVFSLVIFTQAASRIAVSQNAIVVTHCQKTRSTNANKACQWTSNITLSAAFTWRSPALRHKHLCNRKARDCKWILKETWEHSDKTATSEPATHSLSTWWLAYFAVLRWDTGKNSCSWLTAECDDYLSFQCRSIM